MEYFEVRFLREVEDFLANLDSKIRLKITYNIDKARFTLDTKLFKKLTNEIWEFRTRYSKLQYRLLAFWDKTEKPNTLVICTHGFVKKSQKTQKDEIEKAERIRKIYFDLRNK